MVIPYHTDYFTFTWFVSSFFLENIDNFRIEYTNIQNPNSGANDNENGSHWREERQWDKSLSPQDVLIYFVLWTGKK